MKSCTHCHAEFPRTEEFFYSNGIGKGWDSRCKSCAKARMKLTRARLVAENIEYLAEIKQRLGCADCGFNAHFSALDFDHLPGHAKITEVSQLKGCSRARIDAEIAKCEVVCSNCHRIRTYERRRSNVSA